MSKYVLKRVDEDDTGEKFYTTVLAFETDGKDEQSAEWVEHISVDTRGLYNLSDHVRKLLKAGLSSLDVSRMGFLLGQHKGNLAIVVVFVSKYLVSVVKGEDYSKRLADSLSKLKLPHDDFTVKWKPFKFEGLNSGSFGYQVTTEEYARGLFSRVMHSQKDFKALKRVVMDI